MTNVDKSYITDAFKSLQDSICDSIESMDGGSSFKHDDWDREGGGGGRTRVITGGNVIEKGGVNFSAVYGDTPVKITDALGLNSGQFYATGVSIVLHPSNPHVPIIHMNIRYFEMSDGTWWFGGGIDLTPHYVIPNDAKYFHQQLKAVCDKHYPTYYSEFKPWADEYFFIKHRNESRGIGGIFFDRLTEKDEISKNDRFEFVQDVGRIFSPTYHEIVQRNRDKSYSDAHKKWQLLRRGRYVEFNLVYDKGTKFGLDTGGRVESILMSLPPHTDWDYDYQPPSNSPEEKTLTFLKKPIDWLTHPNGLAD